MAQILDLLQQAGQGLSLNEGLAIIQPVTIFVVGMMIYSFFIFKFYRFVARRDIFKPASKIKEGFKKSGANRFFSYVAYIFKHIFLLPILVFFWFACFSVILAFLSKQEGAQMVLLVSIALIATIRVMAYYNEDLSKDLAKMLPFALLGIFLVDISYFSIETSINAISQIPSLWNIMVYYLIFLIVLEFVLRILYGIYNHFSKEG